MVSEEQWRYALKRCAFASRGQRPGLLPFNAHCVAARLAGDERISINAALHMLQQLAQEHNGELVEDEVLWLPEQEYEAVWLSL